MHVKQMLTCFLMYSQTKLVALVVSTGINVKFYVQALPLI